MAGLKTTFKYTSFLIGFIFLISCQNETTIRSAEGQIRINADELIDIVSEAYLFGYPLVIMDLTKKASTNIAQPDPVKALAPLNQLGHYRKFPDHTMKKVVKPNVDTYYSIAWFDLSAGPQVLYMPATERYYLLPFYDAYTNVFASPGTRTTGTAEQEFVIAGPNWKGQIPEGTNLIQAPTDMVWMIGRIQVNDDEDGNTTVRAIQDSMRLTPLHAYGQKDFKPNINENLSEYEDIIPSKAARKLDASTFLNQVAQLMESNPPTESDSALVRKLLKIGLVAGEPFELSSDNIIVKTKLKALPEFIHKKMESVRDNPDASLMTNGWRMITQGLGNYSTDYLKRAYVAFVGLGANWPEDAIYPTCVFDSEGNPLDARKAYQLHFEPSQLPPVNAFWSLTAYNEDEFLVENELNRFALGDRDSLHYNEDGSLDIFIQSSTPNVEQMPNWLPIPDYGRFTLTMRLYWPKETVFQGEWKPPYLVPVKKK